MTISLRRRALAACTASVLSLGLGACAINVGGQGDSSAGSTDQATEAAQAAEASQTDEAEASPEDQASAEPAEQTPSAKASTDQEGRERASAEATSSSGGKGPKPAADRPGASATITDDDWLSVLDGVDRTVRANSAMTMSKDYDYVRIEGDVQTLTISGTSARVVVDYVDTLVIEGDYAEVYVYDVKRVVMRGTSAEVVWAGETPTVEDFGDYNETRLQGTED
ncbi:hypothetical protein ACSL103130_05470 [Actinomyces slackii]|uniref:DUF3060 domain-containing protein n=1 Tax=Actinomyces slackii TaxID=52774 RepID=A0A3S5EM44_9ACTO|nr:hypothetical protein [Actinomyces slackii]VEG74136.1 Uncharacterised protein [Actinomyces slackii]